jgi:V8-like Glu-specific endopeptidase
MMLHLLPELVAGMLGKAITVATQKGKSNVTTAEKKVIGWQTAGAKGVERKANDQRATLMVGAGRKTRMRM